MGTSVINSPMSPPSLHITIVHPFIKKYKDGRKNVKKWVLKKMHKYRIVNSDLLNLITLMLIPMPPKATP